MSEGEHFRQYDYGIVRNFIHYKRIKPPEYKLWKVVVPTYIHYAPADALATPEVHVEWDECGAGEAAATAAHAERVTDLSLTPRT